VSRIIRAKGSPNRRDGTGETVTIPRALGLGRFPIPCARAVSPSNSRHPHPDVTAKHRVPVLRHPDKVALAVPDRMAAALVRFHPANLHREAPRSRPPKGVGFPDPLSGTLKKGPCGKGQAHRGKAWSPIADHVADEARFGRMNRPRPCWAPAGVRPTVASQLIREYVYMYGAVCPNDGTCVFLIMPASDTECFQVS
jgi:hypothetical protein